VLILLALVRLDDTAGREAEEWRAALLASPPVRRQRSGLALALVWWRALVPRRPAARVPLAEKEQL
jgi:hypothetical protein